MMEEEQLDVVSIGTWHTGHAPWTIAAAAYKPKAILCEKPMADTIGHAEQMLVACQRNDVKLVIGHQRDSCPRTRWPRTSLPRAPSATCS